MIGLVLGRSRLAQQPVTADSADVSSFRAENAGISEKTYIRAVGREDVPTVDVGDELAFRAEQMLCVHDDDV